MCHSLFSFYSVTNRHEAVTDALVQKSIALWKCDKLSAYVITPNDVDSDAISVITATENSDMSKEQMSRYKLNPSLNYLFADLLAPVFINPLQLKSKKCWEVFGNFIIQLLKAKLMTISYLNGLCVNFFWHEWPHVS